MQSRSLMTLILLQKRDLRITECGMYGLFNGPRGCLDMLETFSCINLYDFSNHYIQCMTSLLDDPLRTCLDMLETFSFFRMEFWLRSIRSCPRRRRWGWRGGSCSGSSRSWTSPRYRTSCAPAIVILFRFYLLPHCNKNIAICWIYVEKWVCLFTKWNCLLYNKSLQWAICLHSQTVVDMCLCIHL